MTWGQLATKESRKRFGVWDCLAFHIPQVGNQSYSLGLFCPGKLFTWASADKPKSPQETRSNPKTMPFITASDGSDVLEEIPASLLPSGKWGCVEQRPPGAEMAVCKCESTGPLSQGRQSGESTRCLEGSEGEIPAIQNQTALTPRAAS